MSKTVSAGEKIRWWFVLRHGMKRLKSK